MPRSRALVTGAAGFAGRHFAARLEETGWEVDKMDVDAQGGMEDKIFNLDMAPGRYRLVIHCAAVVGGRETIDTPLALIKNFELDSLMFNWCQFARPGRLLYMSSSAVYPIEAQTRPGRLYESLVDLRLSRFGVPDALYGWHKLMGEVMAAEARKAGIPVTVVRPFSGYGEDQDRAYPFRAFLERARAHEDPFQIWGDGYQVRDWIHIDDVVEGALQFALDGVDGPLNLGTGRPVSMYELAGMMVRTAGYKPQFDILREKPMGVSYRVSEPSKMLEHFTPVIDIEEGVKRGVRR